MVGCVPGGLAVLACHSAAGWRALIGNNMPPSPLGSVWGRGGECSGDGVDVESWREGSRWEFRPNRVAGSGREAKLIFTLSSAFMFHLYLPPAPNEQVAMAAACCLSASSLLLLSALIFHRMFTARGLQVSMITKEHVAFCHCHVCIPPRPKRKEC